MNLYEWEFVSKGYKPLGEGIFALESGGLVVTCWLYNTGIIWIKEHTLYTDLSRDYRDGPAQEEFYPDGAIGYRGFYLNGLPHRPREDGAAKLWYEQNGKIRAEEYWEYGRRI